MGRHLRNRLPLHPPQLILWPLLGTSTFINIVLSKLQNIQILNYGKNLYLACQPLNGTRLPPGGRGHTQKRGHCQRALQVPQLPRDEGQNLEPAGNLPTPGEAGDLRGRLWYPTLCQMRGRHVSQRSRLTLISCVLDIVTLSDFDYKPSSSHQE